jgi:hypothetical protein
MEFPIISILWIIVIVVVVGYVSSVILTMPKYSTTEAVSEGFFGGVVRGSGHPDCLRTLNSGSQILDSLSSRMGSTEEAQPDYKEFQLILSKLGCLKKDLMSPSGIIEATRYQPYENAHDREPIAEVTATCLNHTIAPRDLDIIFATWRDRGNFLLRRLCTSTNQSETEARNLEKLFADAWKDVYEVAKGRCLASPAEQEGNAHEAQPYDPPSGVDYRTYDGYFSGWMGQI